MHETSGYLWYLRDFITSHFPIRRSSSVILRQSTHCRPVGAYPFSSSGPAQTKGIGNGNRHNIFSRGRRNRGAPCQAIQSSPCRPSGILRRQNAAAKNSFYTLCIIDEMNIASIFVIAQYCRPKSLREAPK